MTLFDKLVFEEPAQSDVQKRRDDAIAIASAFYEELVANPGKWAKFAEVAASAEPEGPEPIEEDPLVAAVNNALSNVYAAKFGMRFFNNCDTKMRRVGNTKYYYARYRKTF